MRLAIRDRQPSPQVAAMDVLFPKCGEIVGGSQREERLAILEERMLESGLSASSPAMSWYADLRRFGGVPHAGFGLGQSLLSPAVFAWSFRCRACTT